MNKYILTTGILLSSLVAYLPSQVAHASSHPPEQSFQFVLTDSMTIQSGKEGPDGIVALSSSKKAEFIFKNAGKMRHEILLGRGAILKDGVLVQEYNEYLLGDIEVNVYVDGIEVEVNGLREIELDPGKELRIVFTPGNELKGEWEIGCFMPGHYEMGMKVGLRIE